MVNRCNNTHNEVNKQWQQKADRNKGEMSMVDRNQVETAGTVSTTHP